LICIVLICSGIQIITIDDPIIGKASAGSTWIQTTDQDFNNGTLNNLVVLGSGPNAEIRAQRGAWNEVRPLVEPYIPPIPSPRQFHAMATILYTEKVLLYGGSNGTNLDDTWIYDFGNNVWTPVETPTNPGPRQRHAMAPVWGTDKVVMFGGVNTTRLNDTWVFDVSDNTWTEQSPSTAPSARFLPAITAIYNTRDILLFGGRDTTFDDETWIYNLTLDQWTQKSPSTKPSARFAHSMAYMMNSSKVVLFGGSTATGYDQETWEYNNGNSSWTKRQSVVPPNRGYHSMATVSNFDNVILFGGNNGTYIDDTWQYQLGMNTWWQKWPMDSPSPRRSAAMASIYGTEIVVMFGGWNGEVLGDTWRFETVMSNWSMMLPDMSPSARDIHAMATVDGKNAVVLFGGMAGMWRSDETWVYEFDSKSWIKRTPDNRPTPRDRHAMANIWGTNKILLFGGMDVTVTQNDTWMYDFDNDTWTDKSSAVRPDYRNNHRMAGIWGTEKVLLYGGWAFGPLGDTWIYHNENSSWQNMKPPTSPGGRSEYGMAPLWGTDKVILVHGREFGNKNETWVYDLSDNNWTQMSPGNAPTARSGHTLSYIDGDDKVVLFGGMDFAHKDDTWAYDYSDDNWTKMIPEDFPGQRQYHAMTTVQGTDNIVLFGGRDPMAMHLDDTWTYDLSDDMWIHSIPFEPPGPRKGHSMSMINNQNKVLFFGGQDPEGYLNKDTWKFNLNADNWYGMQPSMEPNPRMYHTMAPNYVSNSELLYGGLGTTGPRSDTWVFYPSADNWNNIFPAMDPGPLINHSMATISGSENIVLFGGRNFGSLKNETWIFNFNFNIWSNFTSSFSPLPRESHAMATIKGQDKVLLFGGVRNGHRQNDTWIYNTSSKWMKKIPGPGPSGRYGHAMVSIEGTDKVLLFGGNDGNNTLDDTWLYDYSSNTWLNLNITPPNQPGPRFDHSLATVSGQRKVVLYGGHNGIEYLPDTWIFDYFRYREGSFISQPFDTGTNSTFNMIEWNALTPPGTNIEFQFRSAQNEPNLYSSPFVGPDGTPDSFYKTNSSIWPGHNGDRWFQYIAYFNTDGVNTARLRDVSIIYNRWPASPLQISPFNGNLTNDNTPTFVWNFNDTDSTQSGFQVIMDDDINFASIDYDTDEVVSTTESFTPGPPIADGLWYWKVRTNDSDGDWGPFSPAWNVTIDATPPNSFTPTANPASWGHDKPEISFSTTDALSGMDYYQISIDSGSFSNQTSPYTLPPQSDGIHNVTVRAYDVAGNYIDCYVDVYVDITPPNSFTPSANPASWTNNTKPEITFATTDDTSGIDYYEISIDSGPFSTQTSPYEIPPQTDGVHNITVRAYDNASNYIDGYVDVYIDTNVPDSFTPSANPASWTNNTKPVITFATTDSLSGIDYYEIKIDTGSWSTQTSPYQIPDQSDGVHNITVRAWDNASNYIDRYVDVYIDDTVPNSFTPTANPSTWTNNTQPTITYATTDDTSGIDYYQISIDGGAFFDKPSPYQLDPQTDGVHNITIRAWDNASNYIDRYVEVYIDNTVPSSFTPSASSSGWTNDTTPTITFGTSDATSSIAYYNVSIDGGPFSTQTSPYTLPPQGDGTHNITIRAYDNAGNYVDAYVDVYIDTNPPDSFTPVATPSGWTSNDQPQISFSTTDSLSGIDYYQVKIGSGPFANQTSPYTLPALTDGVHNITVRAWDNASNYIDRYVDVYIDTNPPGNFTPTANPANWTSNTQPEITFSTTDATSSVDHYEVKIDNGAWSTQTSPYTIPSQTDGIHNVSVRAFDDAGNYIENWVWVYIDTTPPNSFTPTANPASWTNKTIPTITFSTNDATSGVDYYNISIDGGAWSTQTSPYITPALTEGTHNITVRAFDEAGNNIDGYVDVYIDLTPPVNFTPVANPAGWTNNDQPQITFSTTDALSSIDYYQVKVDSGSFSNQTSPYVLPSQSDGTHNVTVRAYDVAGNFNDRYVDVYIDKTPPSGFTPTANPSNWTQNTQPIITFSTTDSLSSIAFYQVKIDSGPYVNQTSSYQLPVQTDGTHNITVRAYDNAGNFYDGYVDVYIDTTPPNSFTPTANPASWTNKTTPTITFSTNDATSGVDYYNISIDGGAWSTQTSPYTTPALTEGIHNVTVRAFDEAGNNIDGYVDVYIDLTPPANFTPTADPAGWTNNDQPQITFSTTDALSSIDYYQVRVDSGSFSTQTSPYVLPSQTDGIHNVTVRAYDVAGNYNDRYVDVYIDTAAPSGFTPTANPSNWTQNTQPIITFSTTDSLSSIDFYQVKIDSGSFTNQTSPYTLPVQIDGTHNITVRAYDNAGNFYDGYVDVYIDTTPPNSFTPTANPASWTNDTTPTITFSTNDATSGIDYYNISIDSGAWSTQTSPYTTPALTEGTHNITVRAFDEAGNNIDGFVDVYIDLTPPANFTPTANPSTWTNNDQPQITFSTTDALSSIDHYEVRVDSGGFSTQTSPYTLPSQSDGTHNVTVRAYDVAGNYKDSYVDVYIDKTPPNSFAPTANPDSWTNNTQPIITFSTTDSLSNIDFYQVKIDSGSFTNQTSPYTLPVQTDGTHNITVRAYDNAGNFYDGYVDVFIDTQPPNSFTPTANPASWTNDTTPEISFSTTDVTSSISYYNVSIDSGAWSTQTSPYTTPALTEGTHNITVRAFDEAGNYIDGYVDVYIDLTPPASFTPSANPSSWTQNTQPQITFSTTDALSSIDHYEVSIDGGGFTTQVSPYTLPVQTDGTHNITVRAYDNAGNFRDSYVDVYIDTTPPDSFTTSANPSSWTNDTTPEITFSTTDSVSSVDFYQVKIDSGSFLNQTSPYTLPVLTDGTYNITVRAYDLAGNFYDSYVDVYIDQLPPNSFTPSASPGSWTNNTQPIITFSTTDATSGVNHYEIKIDSGGWSTQTSPYTIPSQTEGTHNITVRAFDEAGNYIDCYVDVYIDLTPPNSFTPTANPSGWTTNTQPQISFLTTDALSSIDHYEVSIDGSGFSTQTSPYTIPSQTDGTHNVTVRAYDTAGNYIDSYVDVYIDTSSPNSFTPGANPGSWTQNTQPQITFATSDTYSGIDYYQVKIDSGGFTTQTSPYTIPSQTDGIHNITIRAFDKVGNNLDRYVDVYIDTTSPNSYTPNANPSSWTQNTQPIITFTTTDATSGVNHYEVKIDFGGWATQTSPYTVPVQIDGTHNVSIRAYDEAGNYQEEWVLIYVDTTPPNIFTPISNPSGWTKNTQPQITFSTTDSVSSIDHYEVSIDSGPWSTQSSPYTIPSQSDGTHNVTIKAIDLAGNSLIGWVNVYIDTAAPSGFSPSATPSGWTQNTQPQITFATTDALSGIDYYEVKIDSGGFSTQTSPYTLPIQTDGEHNVTVRAYDSVGNYVDGYVKVYIDTTPPASFTPTANPASWTKTTQPVITFVTTDATSGMDHFELKINSGGFTTQTSPYTLPPQSDGTHTIIVRAIDNAGNSLDKTVFVYVDTSPPVSFTPTASPSSWTQNTQPQITFTTTDSTSGIDHYEVKVDSGSFSTQTSMYTLPAQTDGTHTITVRAIDQAGNYIDGTVSVYIDTTPPNDFTPTANPSSWTNNKQPQILFNATDATSGIDHYEIKVGAAGSFSTQTSPYTLPNQNDGTIDITVRVYDLAGNYLDRNVNVYIDTAPPDALTLAANPSSWTSNKQPQITFSTTDALSGLSYYQVKVDSGSFTTQTSPYTLPTLTDGTHTITVRAYDNAGNYVEGTINVYIDTTPPNDFTPTASPGSWTNNTTPTITFTTSDTTSGIDRYEVKIGDSGIFSKQSSPYTLPSQDDGEHTITVRAIDRAGNYVDKTVIVYIDTTPPEEFTPTADPSIWTGNTKPEITFTTTDATSGINRYEVRINGGSWAAQVSPYTLPSQSDGTHTITVRVYDLVGNYVDGQVKVYIDTTPPTITHSPVKTAEKGKAIYVTATIEDAHSGVDTVTLFFKKPDDFKYTNLPMTLDENIYYTEISAGVVTGNFLEYYIRAVDKSDPANEAYVGIAGETGEVPTDYTDIDITIKEASQLVIPEIKSFAPTGDNVKVDEEITITFTVSMDPISTERAISISPSIKYSAQWLDDQTLVLQHTESYESSTVYHVNITIAALSKDGVYFEKNDSRSFITEVITIGASAEKDTWSQIEPYVTAGTILASLLAFLIGFISVRRKKGKLRQYMERVDNTYATYKNNSSLCERELIELRDDIKKDVQKGKIEDNHFLILDKRIGDYMEEMDRGRGRNSRSRMTRRDEPRDRHRERTPRERSERHERPRKKLESKPERRSKKSSLDDYEEEPEDEEEI
jgi:hypothetical protein